MHIGRSAKNLNQGTKTIIGGENKSFKSIKEKMHKKHLLLFDKGVQIYRGHLQKQSFMTERGFSFTEIDWVDAFRCSNKCIGREHPSLANIKVALTLLDFKQQVLFLFKEINNINKEP